MQYRVVQQLDIFDATTGAPGCDSDATIELPDASLQHVVSCVPVQRCGPLFDDLMNSTPWSHDDIVMFGKRMKVPRLSSWHGDAGTSYTYSDIQLQPRAWTPPLLEIKALAESVAGTQFNSVLVNLYRDGADSVAWHADDEPELGPEPVIASVSLGATRTFKMKHQTDPTLRYSLQLSNGSALIMSGRTQTCWMHAVPKTAKPAGPRINLTFRSVFAS